MDMDLKYGFDMDMELGVNMGMDEDVFMDVCIGMHMPWILIWMWGQA